MNSILLTGSDGGVGTNVGRLLQARGWSVRSFDPSSGQNLLDEEAVLRAAEGCDAVIHAGAIAHDQGGSETGKTTRHGERS
jgi:nucleoside-diphosphate-sugar epimerase